MPNMSILNVAAYTYNEDGSPKSIIIYGDTKKYKDKIKEYFNGHFLTRFNNPVPSGVSCAFCMSAKHLDEVEKFCKNPDDYKPSATYKKKAKKKRAKTKVTLFKSAKSNSVSPEQLLSSLGLSKAEIISYLMQN